MRHGWAQVFSFECREACSTNKQKHQKNRRNPKRRISYGRQQKRERRAYCNVFQVGYGWHTLTFLGEIRMSLTFAPSLRLADRNFFRPVAVFLVFLLFAFRAFAGQATLAWDASPDSRVTGYNLHYGTQSGTYTSTYSAGSTTSATVTGLTEGSAYYFVVRARDAAGTESANSNQVSNDHTRCRAGCQYHRDPDVRHGTTCRRSYEQRDGRHQLYVEFW